MSFTIKELRGNEGRGLAFIKFAFLKNKFKVKIYSFSDSLKKQEKRKRIKIN